MGDKIFKTTAVFFVIGVLAWTQGGITSFSFACLENFVIAPIIYVSIFLGIPMLLCWVFEEKG